MRFAMTVGLFFVMVVLVVGASADGIYGTNAEYRPGPEATPVGDQLAAYGGIFYQSHYYGGCNKEGAINWIRDLDSLLRSSSASDRHVAYYMLAEQRFSALYVCMAQYPRDRLYGLGLDPDIQRNITRDIEQGSKEYFRAAAANALVMLNIDTAEARQAIKSRLESPMVSKAEAWSQAEVMLVLARDDDTEAVCDYFESLGPRKGINQNAKGLTLLLDSAGVHPSHPEHVLARLILRHTPE